MERRDDRMTKQRDKRKAADPVLGQAPKPSGVLRRMRLSVLFSGRDEDRKAFEKFLEPETETDS